MTENKENTRNYSTGAWSTGDYSTGDYSTGDYSTGDYSTGYRSTGAYSTGAYSTGDYSTGYRSTGDYSTGNWSTGDYSTWHFCTIDYMWFSSFNKPITKKQWQNQNIPNRLYFDLTEWIITDDMTEKEKEDNPTHTTTWWYLRVYDYKEAFQRSYNSASREEQLKIKDIIHFDADIFYEISWIRIDEDIEELTLDEVCKRLWKNIKIVK